MSVSAETRRRMSEAARISEANAGRVPSEETRHATSESMRDMWAALPQEEKDRWARNTARGCKRSPTEPEWLLGLCLERHFPGEWAYDGCGEQDVVLNSRTPDFININGLKAVIEVFGSYHHNTDVFPNKETPEELIARYAKLGFSCLVLWDYECYESEELVERVGRFAHGGGQGPCD